jgi:hypothetical protein
MSNTTVTRDTDTRVQRYGSGRVFRIAGTRRSGLVVARPTTHTYETRTHGARQNLEETRVRPSLLLDFSPRAVGGVNVHGYNDDLDITSEDQWDRIRESFPNALRTGFTGAHYVPEPFTVNGRSYDSFTAYLEFYADADGLGYANREFYPGATVAGVEGAWVLSTSTARDIGLTEAARAVAEDVARLIVPTYTDAELLEPVAASLRHRAERAREWVKRYQDCADAAQSAASEWEDVVTALRDGETADTVRVIFDSADTFTGFEAAKREEANRWSQL